MIVKEAVVFFHLLCARRVASVRASGRDKMSAAFLRPRASNESATGVGIDCKILTSIACSACPLKILTSEQCHQICLNNTCALTGIGSAAMTFKRV